ncbi:MAG: fructosamine kinase family protein [Arenicella sp.]|nr:fructosamine kinase family protein [Arenicella sp.]
MHKHLPEIIRTCFPGAQVQHISAASGGDIHRSFVVELADSGDHPARVFVKTNQLANAAILQSEFESLVSFAEHSVLNYPAPLKFTCDAQAAYLIMQYQPITPVDNETAGKLGAMLAQQHSLENADYGWHQQNFIGSTPQYNHWQSNWVEFYRQCRLQPQLQFAAANGMPQQLGHEIDSVCRALDRLLASEVQHRPVLLHGDLWTGNAGFNRHAGIPVLFDPAPYFGAAETDLAMTELFGRFPSSFYKAYHEQLPAQPGYPLRRAVYNLYHALNHLNLFGSGYLNLVENQLRIINSAQFS